jgi:hypothetical protein
MDEADRASDREETDRNLAIAAARARVAIQPTGACLYCEEPAEGARLFCSTDCSADWERERQLKARQGLR